MTAALFGCLFHLCDEIIQKLIDINETAGRLLSIQMLVIALAALVIETDKAFPIRYIHYRYLKMWSQGSTGLDSFQIFISTSSPLGRRWRCCLSS